jgi:hypothetical protein
MLKPLRPRAHLALLVGLSIAAAPCAAGASDTPEAETVICTSSSGEKRTCPADTTGGVTLARSTGPGACELGRTWGYDPAGVWVSEGCGGEFSLGPAKTKRFGRYSPTQGFKVADTEHGDLNIRVFTYVRYLNQKGFDESYTNAFGQTSTVQQRQDIQLNKAQVYFFGWVLNPKFRYLAYVWTSNTSQGLSAQVVVAGNVQYQVNEHFTIAGGIGALPGTRSTTGSFPYWLSVDARQIADEFFRPSYTTGVWASGTVVPGLRYVAMLGNNLSQLGVDAGQLDGGLNTFSGALTWAPTTKEFGKQGRFGDYERHETVATQFGIRYTRSDETRQGQPTTDSFENVQIRVSDGSVIFSPGLFAPGVQIDEATYQMVAFDAGVKVKGYSLEAEYFRRKVDGFAVRGAGGALPFDELNDDGFQVQASAMAIPETLQVYVGGSKVFGEYGDPWDARAGINWYPWKNEVVRWNFEYAELRRSPVGALSLPYSVGANGGVFVTSFMLWL